MDIVTFETAKRLKEAGFPQPIVRFGQAWYMDDRRVVICIIRESGRIGFVDGIKIREATQAIISLFDMVFAPTAADVFRLLPADTLVSRERGDLFAVLRDSRDMEDGIVSVLNTSLSEALAFRWLQHNET